MADPSIHVSNGSFVEMRGIVKRYGLVPAVDDADFAVGTGEIVGLVGKNGAGKSTLVKILAGLVQADQGEIVVGGAVAEIRKPHDATRLGLAFLHQDLNDVPSLTVAENIYLGLDYPRRAAVAIDWRAARRHASEVLGLVGADISPAAQMSSLSVAQRQLVMLARAISQHARLLVMDEPTSALGLHEVEHLHGILTRLVEGGASVVYVSHRLDEVLGICGRVTVMRDGKVVANEPASALDQPRLVSHIAGDEVVAVDHPRRARPLCQEVLRVERLSRAGVLEETSFSLRSGEVLGIAGLVGSGRTELARLVFGAERATTGRILVHGHEAAIRSPRDALDRGIALLPEDRRKQGLVAAFHLRENITLPTLSARRLVRWLPFPSSARESEAAQGMVSRLSIAAAGVRQKVLELSGGNQQKVVLGKWLLGQTGILIFDEPTQGVDVEAKEEVYREIAHLADQGKAIIVISSEFGELLRVCDRVLVLREGRLVGELEGEELSEERILRLCYAEASEMVGSR